MPRTDTETVRAKIRTLKKTGRLKKRLPKWGIPTGMTGQEREYLRDLKKFLADLNAITETKLISQLQRIQAQANREVPVVNKDSYGDEVDDTINGVQIEMGRRWTKPELKQMAKRRGESVAKINRLNNERNWKRVTGIDITSAEPWLVDYIEAFALNNAQLISSVQTRYLEEVSRTVYQGFQDGLRWETIAEQIAERFGVAESRAELIARDQVNKLNGALTEVRQTELGVERYIWRTMGDDDDRVRDTHREKDGNTYSWDDPPNDTGHPGQDINCVTEDSIPAFTSGLIKSFKRFYNGEIITINVGDKILRVTPNHPVLTLAGWKFAKDIHVGNQTLIRIFEAGINTTANPDRPDANCGEVYRFFENSFQSKLVNGSQKQFHGDGIIDQNINVISPDRSLWTQVSKPIGDVIGEFFFSLTDVHKRLFSSSGQMIHSHIAALCTLGSNVSVLSLHDPLARTHARPLELFRFRLGSWFDSCFEEYASDNTTGDLKLFRQRVLAAAGDIKATDRGTIEMFFIMGDNTLYEVASVSSKFHGHYSGDVFNFETTNGYFLTNNVITGNCRCYSEPVLEDVIG